MKNEFQSRNVNRVLDAEVVESRVISSRTRTQQIITWYDPLLQSFLVEDETGCFLTSCDVFFRTKDDMDVPVVFQLRSMEMEFHLLEFFHSLKLFLIQMILKLLQMDQLRLMFNLSSSCLCRGWH